MVGSVSTLPAVWSFADIANGLMAVPNLISLLALNGVIVAETRTLPLVGQPRQADVMRVVLRPRPRLARRLSAHARIQNAAAGTSLIGTTALTKVTGLTATSAAASTPTHGSPVAAPTCQVASTSSAAQSGTTKYAARSPPTALAAAIRTGKPRGYMTTSVPCSMPDRCPSAATALPFRPQAGPSCSSDGSIRRPAANRLAEVM